MLPSSGIQQYVAVANQLALAEATQAKPTCHRYDTSETRNFGPKHTPTNTLTLMLPNFRKRAEVLFRANVRPYKASSLVLTDEDLKNFFYSNQLVSFNCNIQPLSPLSLLQIHRTPN